MRQRRLRSTLQPAIVLPGLFLIGGLLALSTFAPRRAEAFFSVAQAWITANFSWFYVLAVAIFVIVLLGIAVT